MHRVPSLSWRPYGGAARYCPAVLSSCQIASSFTNVLINLLWICDPTVLVCPEVGPKRHS